MHKVKKAQPPTTLHQTLREKACVLLPCRRKWAGTPPLGLDHAQGQSLDSLASCSPRCTLALFCNLGLVA